MELNIYLVLLSAVLTVSHSESAERNPVKRSYVCPPNFIRLSHKCYFFSRIEATWQEAFYQCQSMHSNLAIIKNRNQDRLIRKMLSRKTLEPLERWLGGRYDWQQKQWKWAGSGKALTYNGFLNMEKQNQEDLNWACIVIDPALQYKWNHRSCLERKHFICHKKLITATNTDKKKLLRQYNVNKLNEIPVPDIPGDILRNSSNFKRPANLLYQFEINNELNGQYAYIKKQGKKLKKKSKNRPLSQFGQYPNGTIYIETGNKSSTSDPVVFMNNYNRRRRNRENQLHKGPLARMRWKTYRAARKNPLHPDPIVEEYNFVKDA